MTLALLHASSAAGQALPGPAPPATLRQCLLLAALLHLWLVLALGNVPGGTAAPGQGVWGSLNVTLRASLPEGAREGPSSLAQPGGAPGDAPTARWGGAVRERPPDAPPQPQPDQPGTARLGAWAPELAAPEPALALPQRVVAPSLETLPLAELAPALAPAPVLPRAPDAPPVEATPMAAVRVLPDGQSLPAPAPPMGADAKGPERAAMPAVPDLADLPEPLPAPDRALASTLPALPVAPDLSPLSAVAAPVAPVAPIWPVLPEPDVLSSLPPVPSAATEQAEAPPARPPAAAAPPAAPEPLAEPVLRQLSPSPLLPARPVAPLPPQPLPAWEPPVQPFLPAAQPLRETAAPAEPAPAPVQPWTPAATPLPPQAVAPDTPDLRSAEPLPPAPAALSETAAQVPATAAQRPGALASADAGVQLGHDVATPPSNAASAPPRLNLELARPRGGELSARRSLGALPLLPRPPDKPDPLADAIERSARPDCRTAHSGAGVLAVVPLALDALKRDGGCKW